MKFFKDLYLTNLFFYIFGAIAAVFAASFVVPVLFSVGQAALVIAIAVVIVDMFMTFHPQSVVKCKRILPKVFSLNDENEIKLVLYNDYSLPLKLTIIDELPEQFQVRDFEQYLELAPYQETEIGYKLTPKSRGEYVFNDVNIFMQSSFGLVEKRQRTPLRAALPVYPSIIQMKNFELKAFSRTSTLQGVKRMRRLGHSYEFEQIKNYVRGDDYRSINWKATSRQGKLMVNQYEDERAQQVYSIIDKSRNMKMPFNGMSLMDYAVNTSLAISNIILKKHDYAGLITFADKIGTVIQADKKSTQLNKILTALYKEKSGQLEADYELLYYAARKLITRRSLLLLYTNFESRYSLERVLPILRKVSKFHLLVVVIFENTEIKDFVNQTVTDTEGIYFQTVARKFLNEKEQMVQILKQYGIQSILTKPEDLSLNTINKYLGLKSRGLI